MKTNFFGLDGGTLVLRFEHVATTFCRDPPTFVFGKIVIFSKSSIDSE